MVTLAANVESRNGTTETAATPRIIFLRELDPDERRDFTLPLKGESNIWVAALKSIEIPR